MHKSVNLKTITSIIECRPINFIPFRGLPAEAACRSWTKIRIWRWRDNNTVGPSKRRIWSFMRKYRSHVTVFARWRPRMWRGGRWNTGSRDFRSSVPRSLCSCKLYNIRSGYFLLDDFILITTVKVVHIIYSWMLHATLLLLCDCSIVFYLFLCQAAAALSSVSFGNTNKVNFKSFLFRKAITSARFDRDPGLIPVPVKNRPGPNRDFKNLC